MKSMHSFKPIVISPNPPTPVDGDIRKKFTDSEGRWLGWADLVQNKAGNISDWHTHPSSETYVYVIRGSLTVHFGNGGSESVTANAGCFLHIPSGVVHQEITSVDSDLEAFVVRVGCQPEEISAEKPS